MDFIPIIKEVAVTAATSFDVSDYILKGKSGVMFYDGLPYQGDGLPYRGDGS